MGEEFVFHREKAFEREYDKPEFRDFFKIGLKSEASWDDIPVPVGRMYEGERIRVKDMYCEFGGPKVEWKGEILKVVPEEEVEDQKVTVIGPEITELKEGGSYPLFTEVKVAGELSTAMELNLSLRIHYWTNFINGAMHLNAKDDIWVRFSKEAVQKGMTLEKWGKVLARLYPAEFERVKKAQVTFYTEPEKVKEKVIEMRKYYEEKEKEMAGMTEENTETWYSCTLCQSFASSHVCIITPERPANCGAITWADAKSGYEMEPTGSWQPFNRGECIDPIRGEWSGANEEVEKRSGGINKRVNLHSLFGYPHTSCGCFEMICFYMPEVDGIGMVDRKYTAPTVNKLPFSTMAARTGGGMQVEGLLGLSKGYARSKKFWQADGGWYRIVWMPKALKEELKPWIPKDVVDKIATEEDALDIETLKKWLKEKDHPVVKGIKIGDRVITKGWKAEFTKEALLEYIEECEGEIDIEECAERFGVSEDEVNEMIEELIEEGVLEV
ncbi:MAG: CO dehydrogenase/CO-methylating acetyl-CoA synthase complex subunit beta [Candidatus Methanospirareceae archaeon]